MGLIHEKLVLEDKFSSALNKYVRALGAGDAGSRKMASGAQVTQQRLNSLGQSLKKQQTITRNLEKEYSALSREKGAMSQAAKRLKNQIDASQKSEYKYAAEIAKTRDALKKASLQEQLNEAALKKKEAALKKATDALQKNKTSADGAGSKIKKIGDESRKASKGADTLTSSIKRIVAAVGGMKAVQGLTKLTDDMTNTNARLKLLTGDADSATSFYNDIYRAAQRARAPVDSFADTVTKMGLNAGHAFSSNEEMLQVMENIAKQFQISGASADEQKNSMIQLTQAMAAGALRGEELNSILDSAPGIARNIEKSMGWATGSIKQYAEKGLVTAEVVKNAMLDSTEEINRQFKEMPMTFSQAATMVKNQARKAFKPIGKMLSNAVNSDRFAGAMDLAGRAIYGLVNIASYGFGVIGNIVDAAADNWYWLAPVIGTVTAAVIAYKVAVGLAAAAQAVYNAVLAASPITWVVIGITLIVAAVLAAAAAFNHFGNISNTILGTLVGAVMGAGSFILNILKIIVNFFISVVESIINAWHQGIYMVKLGIYNFEVAAATAWNNVLDGASKAATGIANAFIEGANLAIGGINWIINALNKIPGVDLATIGTMSKKSVSIGTKIDVGSIKAPTAPSMTTLGKFNTTSGAEAWKAGWEKGSDLGNKASDKVSGALSKLTKGYEGIKDAAKGMGGTYKKSAAGAGGAGKGAGGGSGGKSNVGSVDKVKSVQDDISLADEDVKMFRDLAERKYINKIELKTVQPSINVTENNKGGGGSDAKGIANLLAKVIEEERSEGTDVVYG